MATLESRFKTEFRKKLKKVDKSDYKVINKVLSEPKLKTYEDK